MTRYLLVFLLTILVLFSSISQSKKVTPERKVNRFFGLHFDFHASTHSNKVGETLTLEMLDSMLLKTKPDYVQVDCKGHAGISSYPTKVGTPAPGIIKDPLKIWREATSKYKIPLYVHYSGVYDVQAIKLHPEWARIDEKGNPDKDNTSVFGEYVDKLMIPQLKELSKDYKINGAWIDGDCWSVKPDYSKFALQAFTKETGIKTIPYSASDSGYYAFMDFNRKAFRKYVARYVDAIHAYDPNFLITSNWSYSSMMPEPVDVNVDFLSGDMASRSYVNNAALEARCLAKQGKPWDLMAWGFTFSWEDKLGSYKSAVQLEQEAAHVLSMGGGFQIYYPQNQDASIKPWRVSTMAEVAKFCRDRQAYCEGSTAVPQIAILHSTEGFKRKVKGLYNNWDGIFSPEQGILDAMMDGQHAVEVLMEHHLKGKMRDYALIVIPEWEYLSPDFTNELIKYTEQGGNLLVIGAKSVKLFEKQLGVTFGAYEEKHQHQFGFENDIAAIISPYQPFKLQGSTKEIGRFYKEPDLRYPENVTGSIASLGKGKIAGVYINIGDNYKKRKAPVIRHYLSGIVNELFNDPILTVKGTHLVHVTLNKVKDNTAIHLINMAGPHGDEAVYVYDEVPPIGPFTVEVKLQARPKSIKLQPGNLPLDFIYEKGKAIIAISKLELHSIIMVEP